ncbi:MAG: hypothetical protein JXR51_11770 [Bacteroidales bacterium]|nr:hypothetical protein [Bacteroidales bacterium]MBN2757848.1 hypothetical protein [Bacteroidales bacterium]
MKKLNLLLALVFMISLSSDLFSQSIRKEKRKLWASDMNYEVAVVGIGADGTKLLKVWAYEKKIELAKIEAKKNAVAACLFKGAAGSRDKNVKPILPDSRTADAHEAYFDEFFATGGQYLQYVGITNDATGKDIVKQTGGLWKGGYKVGVVVSVNYDMLRKEMERQGIVKKLGDVLGNAKKPTIMVVPADNWCVQNKFTTTFDDQGTKRILPDYKKAMQQSSDILLVIGKLNTLMADRGFPAKNLETEMKNLESENAEMNMMTSKESGSEIAESPIDILKRTAKADIIIQLNWTVNTQGPKRSITFNLQGLDAYTGKQIAGAQGTGEPSFTAETALLLEEAVLAHLDNFNSQLMEHFTDIAANGREIKVNIKVWSSSDVDLEEEYDYDGEEDELSTIIENWMSENAYQGKFNLSDGSATFMKLEQVRIPLYYDYKGKQRANDAKRFVDDLRKFLKGEPFNITSKTYLRGLGEAWLILGEK